MIILEEIEAFLRKHKRSRIYKRGETLCHEGYVEIIELDEEGSNVHCEVISQSGYPDVYHVKLRCLDDRKNVLTSCTCPFDGPVCKHAIASLLEVTYVLEDNGFVLEEDSLRDILTKTTKTPVKSAPDSPKTSSIPCMNELSQEELKKLAGLHTQEMMYGFLYNRPEITHYKLSASTLEARVIHQNQAYSIQIEMTEHDQLICTCNCGQRKNKICFHAYVMLINLSQQYHCQPDVVFPLRNHKNLLSEKLKEYGYKWKDNWQELFEVELDYPTLHLYPKDPGLSKIAKFANWRAEIQTYVKPFDQIEEQQFKLPDNQKKYAILWEMVYGPYNIPGLHLIHGKRKKNGDIGAPIRKLDNKSLQNTQSLPIDRKMQLERLSNVKPSIYLGTFDSFYTPNLNPKQYKLAVRSIHKQLLRIYPSLLHEDHYLIEVDSPRDTVAVRDITRIYPQEEYPTLAFEFRKSTKHYLLKPFLVIDDSWHPIQDVNFLNFGIFSIEDRIYLLKLDDADTALFFKVKQTYRIRHEDLADFSRDFLMPLAEKYTVQSIGHHFELRKSIANIQKKVYLREVEDYLLLIPAFEYTDENGNSREVKLNGESKLIFQAEGMDQPVSIDRATDQEEHSWNFFRNLHPSFEYSKEYYFALPIDQVLEKNWFFKTFEQIMRAGYEVMGLKALNKIKYNPFRPVMQIRASSGTDWFDLQMDVSFGDQKVKLTDIRKAIMNRQSFVKLGDGSLGMLPEDWLKKYSSILKMGKVSKNNLKVSLFQVGLMEDWADEVENPESVKEILQKRKRLREFRKIKDIELPVGLKATLRNYQKEGYNWLNFLDEFSWGGCLADDMGLGKTLQVLCFLMKVSQEHPGSTHLIVVPRSLVFNWVGEIEKFSTGLCVLCHTGSERIKSSDHFSTYDLIITTYGLVRSDIDWLKEYVFGYVVLDESQAIKNPLTQAAKAVKMLKSRNRLVMTGTPVENNTFDLYSQMDFLNPGMLGSIETFRTQFANPIDKDRDEKAAADLRKLVYPFILSRKKQEVAKELPEKTEIILYCNMSKAQRKVYDYYKDTYRDLITEKIEQEGMNKAGIYILQGLSRLRQICNSPQLLPADEGEFTQDSAKLEVLMEHLDEIFAEGHKVLVFSFFTGMLDLIGRELTERSIEYVLLTGQSQNREKLVSAFKESNHKKAFLISLKAGGFGLNLTEASYVFLVDPWWNPAVEQQAIDRTHRIGQTRQVFAYKMICLDTIEEKILNVQDKKLAISQDIIHTETGYIKKLTPDDVRDLFQ